MAAKAKGEDTKAATAEKAAPVTRMCGCLTGTDQKCDRTTQKSFAQGHDARMSGRIATAIAKGEMTAEDGEKLIREAGGGDQLVSKCLHSADLRKKATEEGGKPKAKKTAKGGPKADATLAAKVDKAPSVLGRKVQVFHGTEETEAVIVRDATATLVARHRVTGKNCDHEVEVEGGNIFTK